jgi:hypothetical protein
VRMVLWYHGQIIFWCKIYFLLHLSLRNKLTHFCWAWVGVDQRSNAYDYESCHVLRDSLNCFQPAGERALRARKGTHIMWQLWVACWRWILLGEILVDLLVFTRS